MILFIFLVIYMAIAYRYRGGWRLGIGYDSPRWLELLAVSWPMGLSAWLALAGLTVRVTVPPAAAAFPLVVDLGPAIAVAAALAVILLTALLHSFGHGNAMNLGRRPYGGDEREEIWDVVAGPLVPGTGYDARWRRDAIALALSGVVILWPLAVAVGATGRWDVAGFLLFAGAGKVGAYELGWRLHVEDSRWLKGTEIGEVLFGALLGMAVAAAL